MVRIGSYVIAIQVMPVRMVVPAFPVNVGVRVLPHDRQVG
jgi:hypothetical protein